MIKDTCQEYKAVLDCCGASVNAVIKAAMEKESTDNLSVIMLIFSNFQKMIK